MSLSTPFIHRPVGTTLLTIALALAGGLAYTLLPVSPLPQVEYPSVSVSANLPGASPETMASAVATPLERQFGRIAGITEMTSSSYLGSTQITMQFDLSRNIDAAARDVQAAINAAAGQLPTNLPSRPSYRKVNPSDPPIMILSLTSDVYDRGQMYDAASNILQQKLSQVPGVGQVSVSGAALPAVRVDVRPSGLNNIGLGLEDVRAVLGTANANAPKGELSGPRLAYELNTSDQLLTAKEYAPLIVAYRNGAPVRLRDVADVTDSVEDIRTSGLANGKPAVLVVISRQPGANIIDTVDRVTALLPQLQAQVPAAMKLDVVLDRTVTIRGSVRDVQISLLLSIGLVILVVFIFLRSIRSTIIPSVAVPISLIGTFGVMYLCNYSLDNLSLMALTVATGFVVDDAIVVIENITRHIEGGMKPMEAALLGAEEIGFTVVSISISLVAVFIPILLMTGIVGRLFREFAVTLSVAIGMSMIVSLTTTPMMCSRLLLAKDQERHGALYRFSEGIFNRILRAYEVTLGFVLRQQFIVLLITLATIVLTITLYVVVPKSFFPPQDTGRLNGSLQADQKTSSQKTAQLLATYADRVAKNPDVESVIAFSGGGRTSNTATMFATLKPLGARKKSAEDVVNDLRKETATMRGAVLNFQRVEDLKVGGRQGALQYQYTLQGDNVDDLLVWAPKVLDAITALPVIAAAQSDQQNAGLQAGLEIDREAAARYGITPKLIDDTLYDAFGQRQVSTMYRSLNQYHVVMEVDPALAQSPEGLSHIYLTGSGGAQVPLSAVTRNRELTTPLAIAHSAQFPSVTISFSLKPGVALGDATVAIDNATRKLFLPPTIHGTFSGTAQVFQETTAGMPLLIAFALIAVYIVLGILYESLIHPITILSTIPSAGVGAMLALLLTGTEFTFIAFIGIILLIGIVKKNAIMMIDFALEAERGGKSPEDAIFQACLLRFRPITMTTMAALLGGLPLALGTGVGAELRRPLGIAIVGGLIFSQMLTLYTTPVIYLYMDRLRLWSRGLFHRSHPAADLPLAPLAQ